jgi:ElaB/YqjD/DUF883 family membrane-anchored ribosome-binding protein
MSRRVMSRRESGMEDAGAEHGQSGKPDMDQIREDLKALRASFVNLVDNLAKIAAGAASRQARRAADTTKGAAERAATVKDSLGERVKERPLAALSAAAIAGLVIGHMARR